MTTPVNTAPLMPPVAATRPHETYIHDLTLTDNYFYLREKESPDVVAYLEAENAYTESVMKPTEAFQEDLYREILGRIKETDEQVPYRDGDYFYYTRTEQGKQYPIYCRKSGSLETDEQVVLDLNEIGKDQKFTGLGVFNVSDDGNLLAYAVDSTGFREYRFYLKDLRTGELLGDNLGNIAGVAWANDNKTLFYVVEDDAKRAYRVYRHVVGTGKDSDVLLYEETDETFRVGVVKSRSHGYVFIASSSFTSTEWRYLPADQPEQEPTLLFARQPDREYFPDHRGDQFFLRINDTGKNFRLVTVPVANPTLERAEEIIPQRDDVMLEDFDVFQDFLVAALREAGLEKLHVRSLEDGTAHDITFPEPAYTASVSVNRVFDTDTLRFQYQSLVTPPSVFDYNMRTRTRELKKQQPVLGDFKSDDYQSERVWATASDGTQIPLSIVYKKGTEKNGQAPLLLYGYGSYGISIPASFSVARLSLLNRGVIFAIGHIRGGGDMGRAWEDDGKMMQKMNTFTDFIACAEHLVKERYTKPDKLIIQGGSAGGLLVGAVTNLRPDLFRAVVAEVPFMDVINTMLDATLPLTVGEYEQWGNPNEKSAFDYIMAYSPYDNIAPKDYPAMLVRTSLNDSQVMYWEPAKYVAKLRANKTDPHPLLFKCNMDAGHGGASGRYDALKEAAFAYTFMLWQWGLLPSDLMPAA